MYYSNVTIKAHGPHTWSREFKVGQSVLPFYVLLVKIFREINVTKNNAFEGHPSVLIIYRYMNFYLSVDKMLDYFSIKILSIRQCRIES